MASRTLDIADFGLTVRIRSAAAYLSGMLEKHIVPVLLGLSVYYFALTGLAAKWKPLWYDELFTRRLAELPNIRAVLAAIGVLDAQPPSYAVLTHFCVALFGPTAFAVRLPSLVGMWLAMAALYALLAEWTSPICALVAAISINLTFASDYAFEARPYGLLIGVSALTLLFWHRATATQRWGPRLAFIACIFSIICAHYYGVLIVTVFLMAELVRTALNRRLDWPIWIGILGGYSPLLLFYRFYRPQSPSDPGAVPFVNWNSAHLTDALRTYATFLEPAAIPVFLFILMLALFRPRPKLDSPAGAQPTVPEWLSIIGFALLPFGGYLIGRVTGAYQARYVLPAILSASIIIALSLFYVGGRHGLITLCTLGAFAILACGQLAISAKWQYVTRGRYNTILSFLENRTSGPIAIAPPKLFYELWSYAPPEMRSRLWYPLDSESAVRYTHTNIHELTYPAVQSYDPIQIDKFDKFVSQHPSFYVYTAHDPFEWLVPKLAESGCRMEWIAAQGDGTLLQANCVKQ